VLESRQEKGKEKKKNRRDRRLRQRIIEVEGK
jgi:hypothetical protein